MTPIPVRSSSRRLALPRSPWAWVALTALAAGCDASRLSESEARETFEGVNVVAGDVVLMARDAVEQGARCLSVAEDPDGFEVFGTASDGNGWTGTTTITGSASDDGDQVGYLLTVTFDEVTPAGGPTLDGEITLDFWVDEVGAADLKWTVGIAVDGDLDVSGAAEGEAHLHYDLTLAVDGWSVSFTATGQLNGYDVSGWTFGLSIF